MKHVTRLLLFLLTLGLVYESSLGQEKQEKEEYLEVPLKYVTFLLINDTGCPLQLTSPRVLATKKGHLNFFYTASNNSDSSVKSFQIEEFDAFVNPSYAASPNGKATDESSLVPYDSFSTLGDETRIKIVPLDEKRAAEFKLSEEQKRIWLVLVTKVESYDGTSYDATSKFAAIRKFIDQIQDEEDLEDEEAPKPPLTGKEKEQRLREFITDQMKKGSPR